MSTQLETEPTLRDLVQVYRRRQAVVYGVTAAICILAAIYCIYCTRRYQAIGSVQVQKEGVDAMGLEDLMSSASGDASNPLSADIELQTQSSILQSDTLALRTIEQLHMEGTQDFRNRSNPISWIMEKFSPSSLADPPGATLENSPLRRYRALKVFSKNLDVKPITGTRLIEVSYMSPDPKLSAAVVNTLIQALSDYAFQTRYNATDQASKWLSEQLGDLRKQSEDLQQQVVNVQRQSGVYSFGITDSQGREEAYSGILDQLQQATAGLTVAEQSRIVKGAIAKAADSGNAEMLSGLAGNSMIGQMQPTSTTSLTLIQSLRQQEAAEQAALKEAETRFGPAYPKIAELKGNLVAIDHSIQTEISRIKGRADSDYQIAIQTEATTRRAYDEAKKQADILNNKAIEYVILRQEAEQSRKLYEDLLTRLKEAGVIEGLRSSNITLVDPGRTPAKPKVPNVPVYMALAVFGGWFLGCCSAFVTESLDNKINTVHDLEVATGQLPLGVLPRVDVPLANPLPSQSVLALADPASTYVEAMRSIRTALMLSQTDAPPKVILVTSGIAGEGKSLCAVNLAVILAQGGRRTLIVDTDLRRGTLRARLGLAQGAGLSDLLAGRQAAPPIHVIPGCENLDILAAGARPPNPTDLLESEAMKNWLRKFRDDYDFVVLDSAPVLPVTDSVSLNSLADATLLLARSQLTQRPQLQRSYSLLRRGGKHFVGLVLNSLSINDSSYYGYYGYRKNAYPYAEENDSAKN